MTQSVPVAAALATPKEGQEAVPLCPCRLILFCVNLFIGLISSQLIPEWMDSHTYSAWKSIVKMITMFCVAYIMIHVGFHFDLDKGEIRKYGTEYLVAMTAAGFPWIFCAIYFMVALGPAHNLPWQEALIAARFAAPTSAGILFTMLEAAGMKETWLFQKARILAIFDDLDTLLLMVPLKAIYIGLKWELSVDLVFVTILLIIMYVFLHRLTIPHTWPFIVLYAICIAFFCEMVHFASTSDHTDPQDLADTLHLEVLLPAFTVGCVIYHEDGEDVQSVTRDESLSRIKTQSRRLEALVSADTVKASISAVFMVLVGLSMPSLFNDSLASEAHRRLDGDSDGSSENMEGGSLVLHVIMCSILMNVGKLFPALCYRKEVSLRTRVSLAVAMMPRGEVCAGIIVNAIALGIEGAAITIAVFCLALNMMMVSGFIFIVRRLPEDQVYPSAKSKDPAEPFNEAAPPDPKGARACDDAPVVPSTETPPDESSAVVQAQKIPATDARPIKTSANKRSEANVV